MIVASALRLPYADRSAHCAVTSPPYYAKRVYKGVEPTPWPSVTYSPMPGLPAVEIPAVRWKTAPLHDSQERLCPVWLDDTPNAGILGLEPDPLAYIGHLVLIFREAWRVLRDDGVLCINIGDTYYGGRGGPQGKTGQRSVQWFTAEGMGQGRAGGRTDGYKPKDLMGIPWRLAFALIADGWTLRSRMPGGEEMRPDVIWTKNAKPESVRDRPSVDFEDVFILSKQRRYCWDEMNAREATAGTAKSRGRGEYPKGDPCRGIYKLPREPVVSRNWRASWYIISEPTSDAHYAAFPTELVRRLIRIGTSDKGCCPECGAQWKRALKRTRTLDGEPAATLPAMKGAGIDRYHETAQGVGHWRFGSEAEDLGWQPPCDHGVDPAPCSVLDPFSGIGRTGEVCYETGRLYMPAEISPAYARMQALRLADHVAVARGEGLPPRRAASISGPLFEVRAG